MNNIKDEFIKKGNLKHNNKYDYSLFEYINSRTRGKIICNDKRHGYFEFLQKPNMHINGNGCPKCGRLKAIETQKQNSSKRSGKTTREEDIEEFEKIHGKGKYDYSKYQYINSKTLCEFICNTCNNSFFQYRKYHYNGGCIHCAKNKVKLGIENFIKKADLKHNNLYDYSKSEYINAKTPIEIICQLHGSFWQTPDDHIAKFCGCPVCNNSKGELFLRNLFIKHSINFIPQYHFNKHKDLDRSGTGKYMTFDFYLPDNNVCIEYDGEQHFKPFDIFGGAESFEGVKLRDKLKNEFCLNNNVKLIRIKYTEILNDKLENKILSII